MNLPKGFTEQEVINIIDGIANSLASKFRFGYNDLDDMKQYARMFGFKSLDKFDPNRGKLSTFLWRCIHNELYNLKRNNFVRPNKPCLDCPLKAYIPDQDGCSAYDDKMDCNLYLRWFDIDSTKRNIVHPIEISNVKDDNEDNMKTQYDIIDVICYKDIINTIDKDIPITLRPLWLRLKNGISLNASDRKKLMPALLDIIERSNIDVS